MVLAATAIASIAVLYDVDPAVLARWRDARRDDLAAGAALVGAIERRGWRAPPSPSSRMSAIPTMCPTPAGDYIDVVFTAPPRGPDDEPAVFVEVENDQGGSVNVGEWLRRDDGYWVVRVPARPPAEMTVKRERTRRRVVFRHYNSPVG